MNTFLTQKHPSVSQLTHCPLSQQGPSQGTTSSAAARNPTADSSKALGPTSPKNTSSDEHLLQPTTWGTLVQAPTSPLTLPKDVGLWPELERCLQGFLLVLILFIVTTKGGRVVDDLSPEADLIKPRLHPPAA